MMKTILRAIVLTLLFTLPVISQNTYHVNVNNGDDTNDGLAWSTAFKNIQPAINTAASGDIIYVAEGTYYPTDKIADVYGGKVHQVTPTGNRHRSFLLKKDIQLLGGFPSDASGVTPASARNWKQYQTILSGDFNGDDGDDFENTDENALHVVVMLNASSEMLMEGFYIMNGGGTDSASVYIDGNPIPYGFGGGIYAYSNQNSSPILSNLVIRDNKVTGDGGGFYNYSDNVASPTLKNLVMVNNVARVRGGAIYNEGGTSEPILNNVNITGNVATIGGGILCMGEKMCNPVFNNALLSGNKAKAGAGAYIRAIEAEASPIITNTTVSGNKATEDGDGGGLVIIADIGEANPQLRNTVIWGNKGKDENNLFIHGESGANPVYANSLIEGLNPGSPNISGDTDPSFSQPVDADFAPTVSDLGNYQLLPKSPLVNKGENSYISLSKDLSGNDRIYAETVDIGAYELQEEGTANSEMPATEKTVWGNQEFLYVKVNSDALTVRVYTVDGILIKQINNLAEGTYQFSMPTGIYIVELSDGTAEKIFIR